MNEAMGLKWRLVFKLVSCKLTISRYLLFWNPIENEALKCIGYFWTALESSLRCRPDILVRELLYSLRLRSEGSRLLGAFPPRAIIAAIEKSVAKEMLCWLWLWLWWLFSGWWWWWFWWWWWWLLPLAMFAAAAAAAETICCCSFDLKFCVCDGEGVCCGFVFAGWLLKSIFGPRPIGNATARILANSCQIYALKGFGLSFSLLLVFSLSFAYLLPIIWYVCICIISSILGLVCLMLFKILYSDLNWILYNFLQHICEFLLAGFFF